jgi:xanthine dehydrogenase YagS FAD-binding subunit
VKAFAYKTASSEEAAARLLGEKALALAGGTNLLNLMKDRVLEPDVLVDIRAVPGTASIQTADGGLRIGANVTLRDILEHPEVREGYPALHQALYNTGSTQIRNVATLGGNLCARPSNCWYFARESFSCLKRGGEGCPAKDGENDFHAIFDTSGACVIVHPSSAAPALVVYDAKVRIAGPDGAREVGIEEFFVTLNPRVENVLKPNEIVTHVTLGPKNRQSATYEVRQKVANDWPLSLAAVSLTVKAAVCTAVKICLGAVAPAPRRAREAEAALLGKAVTETTAAAAADAAVKSASPLAKNAYKVQTTHAAVRRAILLAAHGRF